MTKKIFSNKKALILGSGGLRIGQAGEFDYSGSQAIKALRQENIYTILVNPNIATVQTDPDMANELYLLPLDVNTIIGVIDKERPDGILFGFGGQTALNLGIALEEKGILKDYNVEVLGTPVKAIKITEDREIFKQELKKAEIKTARSFSANTVEEALEYAQIIGYPIMMRSGFSLGGLGSGKILNKEELITRANEALHGSSQILIEEYLGGWKEIEYEILRDKSNNVVTVCNMENFDPMGIHTGESIVVAPSQTLSNTEFHFLREIAIKTAKHLGIIGECNIQYALNPSNGDYRVIEVNARLSRSSALASKATGYPLAYIATKLSLGYNLFELSNSVTQETSAFFEPALDYVVVKIPRWDVHKLKSADNRIGSEMKSVGEVMAIGRSFPEAIQKAIRMLNIGADGFTNHSFIFDDPKDEISTATDRRLFAIYDFFKNGGSVDQAHQMSFINKWFLCELKYIVDLEKEIKLAANLDKDLLLKAKQAGFSDNTLGELRACSEESIRSARIDSGVVPAIKQIDTLAGEFAAHTNYLYLTYHGCDNDITKPLQPAIIVLGSGPYCIGSSVEFDWCAVNTVKSLKSFDEKVIIINSNPETVSTDYDESDCLYFEELSLERIRDIADFEKSKGIIVSMGGQIPNNLAIPLHEAGYKILGTAATNINMAENRELFSSLLNKMGIDQPVWEVITTFENAEKFANSVGYPLLVRPSYVLSGAAMNVVSNKSELRKYLRDASHVSQDYPVVISQFITNAKELEIDGVADNGIVVVEAISEHIENAGIHSGDATIVLPPQRLYLETIRRTKKITRDIAKMLNISGPFNIQFIAKDNEIKVIECNVRASRSFPFVSKVTNHNFIQVAIEVMLGKFSPRPYETLELGHVGIKSPQFSYNRLKGANPVASVEMASTGEVACLGDNLQEAFYASWLATEQNIKGKRILVSVWGDGKNKVLDKLRYLEENGWEIFCTLGTHEFLSAHGVGSIFLYKASDQLEPNITTIISEKQVDLIINIPSSSEGSNITDGFIIRRLAIDHHIPLITNLQIAQLLLECLIKQDKDNLPIKSWRDHLEQKNNILEDYHVYKF